MLASVHTNFTDVVAEVVDSVLAVHVFQLRKFPQ